MQDFSLISKLYQQKACEPDDFRLLLDCFLLSLNCIIHAFRFLEVIRYCYVFKNIDEPSDSSNYRVSDAFCETPRRPNQC